MQAVISAGCAAGGWRIGQSEGVVAVALVLDAHLKDGKWNSLLDMEAVLVAPKVAVVNIWIANSGVSSAKES